MYCITCGVMELRSYGVAHTTWYVVVLVTSSYGVRYDEHVGDGVTHDAAPL